MGSSEPSRVKGHAQVCRSQASGCCERLSVVALKKRGKFSATRANGKAKEILAKISPTPF